VQKSSCEVPVILALINQTLNFLTDLRKNVQISKFHENPSSGSRAVPCGQKDRPTGVTKLTVISRNFADAPKESEDKPEEKGK